MGTTLQAKNKKFPRPPLENEAPKVSRFQQVLVVGLSYDSVSVKTTLRKEHTSEKGMQEKNHSRQEPINPSNTNDIMLKH